MMGILLCKIRLYNFAGTDSEQLAMKQKINLPTSADISLPKAISLAVRRISQIRKDLFH
jgi:hypothetical protein